MQNLQAFQIAWTVSQISVYGRERTGKGSSKGGARAFIAKGNHRQANFRAAVFLLVTKTSWGVAGARFSEF